MYASVEDPRSATTYVLAVSATFITRTEPTTYSWQAVECDMDTMMELSLEKAGAMLFAN